MTTIDRHIVKTFLSGYLILLLLGIGLYVFSDVLVNLDEYTEDPNLSGLEVLGRIIDFHGYKLPLYFHQLGGVMMAIAAAFTFAVMLRNNELTPLAAAGVPLQRLAVPVLLCATGLIGLWLVNSEIIIPTYAAKIARTDDDLINTRQVEVLCVRDDNKAILKAGELHAAEGWLRNVYIIEPDAQGNPLHLIRADAAVYRPDPDNPEKHTWVLDRGARLVVDSNFESGELGEAARWESLTEYPFTLAPDQILLRQSSQWAELMSFRQMNRLLQTHNLPNLPAVAKARDVRFCQPLLTGILIVLAIPYFLSREPTNVLVAGGKALLLTGSCYGFSFLAHSMSTDPANTQLAAALPVLVFGPVAVLYLANVKT